MSAINLTDPLEVAMSDAVNNYGNAILAHIEQQIKPLREQIAQLKAEQSASKVRHEK